MERCHGHRGAQASGGDRRRRDTGNRLSTGQRHRHGQDIDEAVLLSDRVIMMTNGPEATIGEILEVNLPRPRDRVALQSDPEYIRCREAILDFLYKKFAKNDE